MSKIAKLFSVAIVAVLCVVFLGCGASDPQPNKTRDAQKRVNTRANSRAPYEPKNDVEFNNFNAAQKLYDSPTTIIWCSTTWGNPSAPIVTVPIAGKLTSSSVSYFSPDAPVTYEVNGDGFGPIAVGVGGSRSVDGMYHGSPPPYRYGFTPGGQYVDFSSMPTFCTTALTKFQRQQTKVSISVDSIAREKDSAAQAALKRGDKAEAQRILDSLESE